MKKILTILALLMPLMMMAQSYSKLWKSVDKAQNEDLPRTALGYVDQIVTKARSNGDDGELIKGLIAKITLSGSISQDSAMALVPKMEELCKSKTTEPNKSVYHMVLGWLYSNMDPRLHADCTQKAMDAFEVATSNPEALARTSSKAYLPILDKGADSRYYGDDMLSVVYPFVARQLKNMSVSTADMIASDVMGKEVSYYRNKGNREATYLSMIDSVNILGKANHDFYERIAKDYRDLSINAEAYAWLCQNSFGKEKYDLCNEALKLYPKSNSTNTIRNILNQHIQSWVRISINKDFLSPGSEASLVITHRNIEGASIKVYRLPFASYDEQWQNLSHTKLPDYATGTPVIATNLKMKHGEPYEMMTDTNKLAMPNMPGIYLVEFRGDGNTVDYETISLSSLAVMQLELPNKKVRLCVLDYKNGKPQAGAHIKLLSTVKQQKVWRDLTCDANGEVVIDDIKEYTRVFAYTDTDKAMPSENLTRSYERKWNQKDNHTICKIYTDRGIYRPGQVVKVGGFMFNKDGDSTRVLDKYPLEIVLKDANYKVLEKKQVETNDLGAYGAEFQLPQNCLNGSFSISTNNGSVSFKVEEYKRPKFKVNIEQPHASYSLGDTLTVSGEVKTYSGLPLANTKLYCSNVRNRSWWFYCEENEAPVTLRDTITTDEEGRFQLPVYLSKPKEDSRWWRPRFYTFTVSVKATAEDGETEEARIRLDAGNIKAFISSNTPHVICKEQMPNLVATRTNSQGQAVEGQGNYALCQGKDTLQSGTLTFNKNQEINNIIKSLPSGEYILKISDENTREDYPYTTTFTLLSLNDTKTTGKQALQVWQSSKSFSKDKPVDVMVGTSLKDTWLRYDFMANGKLYESKTIAINDTILHFTYDYKEEFDNGASIIFAIYNNGYLYTENITIAKPLPDKELKLNWTTFRDKLQPGSEEKWTLSVTKNGKPVEASVLATMYDASLDKFGVHTLPFQLNYDRYILNLGWQRSSRNYFDMNLSKSVNLLEESELSFTIPSNALFASHPFFAYYRHDGFGGAKMMKTVGRNVATMDYAVMAESAPLAKPMAIPADAGNDAEASNEQETDLTESTELRTNFDETAFFASSLSTNAKGEAQIEFKLPESLTSWNFRALAHTRNMDYGMLDNVIIVEKQLMVQANMPRFLRSGDKTLLSITIRNNSDKAQSGKTQLSLTDAQTGKQIKLLTQDFNIEAKQTTTLNFPVETATDIPLLICKYVAKSKDYSDGEQQYLPVLADLQETITSVPFELTDSKPHDFSLSALDYNNKAVKQILTVEYTGNPAWTAINALPTTVNYNGQSATQMAINYCSTATMRQIINDNPQILTLINTWKDSTNVDPAFLPLENNQELKQLVLNETPWTYYADKQKDQLKGLFQDDATLREKQQTMLDKLKKMQNEDGGWQWYKGMPTSTWLTLDIADMLVRTKALCPSIASDIDPMLNKAFSYLDKEAAKAVKELKEEKAKTISTFWMRYLYVTSICGWEKTSERKYLVNRLATSALDYDLYCKALAACVLQIAGKTKEAALTYKSLMEYTVAKPGMGRYFDSQRAPSSWSMYKIPAQVATIEALQMIEPDNKQTLAEMKLWLLQSKHTQAWNDPLSATRAINCLLATDMLAAPTALPAKLDLTLANRKTIDINNIGDINPFVQLGYVKASLQDKEIASAPKTISVQQSAATLEQPLSYGAVYLQNYLPASAIEANGAEIHLSSKLFKQVADGWQEIGNNTILKKGERVMIRYEIIADRNFDFVGLKDGRAACLEPTSTASGWSWQQGCYQSVEDASTTWFYDHLSKGKHVLEATYDVDRSGTFTSACPQIQCQYAPEYNARAKNYTLKVE